MWKLAPKRKVLVKKYIGKSFLNMKSTTFEQTTDKTWCPCCGRADLPPCTICCMCNILRCMCSSWKMSAFLLVFASYFMIVSMLCLLLTVSCVLLAQNCKHRASLAKKSTFKKSSAAVGQKHWSGRG